MQFNVFSSNLQVCRYLGRYNVPSNFWKGGIPKSVVPEFLQNHQNREYNYYWGAPRFSSESSSFSILLCSMEHSSVIIEVRISEMMVWLQLCSQLVNPTCLRFFLDWPMWLGLQKGEDLFFGVQWCWATPYDNGGKTIVTSVKHSSHFSYISLQFNPGALNQTANMCTWLPQCSSALPSLQPPFLHLSPEVINSFCEAMK